MTENPNKQRVGQWIWNHIANECKVIEPLDQMIQRISNRIFNMSDTEFYQLLELKKKEEYKPLVICPKHHRVLSPDGSCRDCVLH